MDTQVLHVRLPNKYVDRLKEMAEATGVPASTLIRMMVKAAIDTDAANTPSLDKRNIFKSR
jgi:predicted DNA-binding protein